MRTRLLIILCSALWLGGCTSGPTGDAILAKKPGDTRPSPITSSPTVMKSGVKYWDIQVGTGATPKKGQQCIVHYVGWLADGSRFASSRATGKPLVFKLGGDGVIPGFNEGVPGMRVGGKRRLEIPPALGYGSKGIEKVIPPDATLLFDVELQVVQ